MSGWPIMSRGATMTKQTSETPKSNAERRVLPFRRRLVVRCLRRECKRTLTIRRDGVTPRNAVEGRSLCPDHGGADDGSWIMFINADEVAAEGRS